jgi:hypothetical protein
VGDSVGRWVTGALNGRPTHGNATTHSPQSDEEIPGQSTPAVPREGASFSALDLVPLHCLEEKCTTTALGVKRPRRRSRISEGGTSLSVVCCPTRNRTVFLSDLAAD